MTALWVHETAAWFWGQAGGAPDAFPRDLEEAASWALPLGVVALPGLRIAAVDRWLAARESGPRLQLPDRALRACVLVHEGNGLLFFDGADEPAERRFSVAHEVAHFLVEHAVPRERARRRLGPAVAEVLDGRRPPSHGEQLAAILAGVRLDVRIHLMERTPDGHAPHRETSRAERLADDLAFELLAPLDEVRARQPAGAGREQIERALRDVFGLPAAPAGLYARRLAPTRPEGTLFRRLFSVS